MARKKETKRIIHSCQKDIFIVASEFAVVRRDVHRLEYRVDESMLRRVEQEMKKLEKRVKPAECCFLIPGGNTLSALLDVCRCVARRAERKAVSIYRRRKAPNRIALIYLNRLSDLLYLLARETEKRRTPFVAIDKKR